MPTTFRGQNGDEFHQETPIEVAGCPTTISLSSHSLKARNLTLKVYVPTAGKLKASGKGLSSASKSSGGRETLTLSLHANRKGRFKAKVKLTFVPSKGHKQAKAISLHV